MTLKVKISSIEFRFDIWTPAFTKIAVPIYEALRGKDYIEDIEITNVKELLTFETTDSVKVILIYFSYFK